MKKRILIVDDNPRILTLIREALEEEGFMVMTAASSNEAVRKAKTSLPELILLDIMLPGIGGWEICRVLKNNIETKSIPIIIMTGTSVHPDDKIRGLEIGAFDYITKPFHSGELVARVKAVLRRREMKGQSRGKKGNGNVLTEKNIIVDVDNHMVQVNRKSVELRPKEFDLLAILLKQKGKVLSRRYLRESIWGREFSDDSRSVDMTVRRLREKLGKTASSIITVQTRGYKFVKSD